MEIVLFFILILIVVNIWRIFIESTGDYRLVRLLEPWYWFLLNNLVLSLITGNYDYQFVWVGMVLQLALSGWLAISIGWIIQSCPHKNAVLLQSWFAKGKTLKFCHRCGTRLPKEVQARVVRDDSWSYFWFHIPAHLLEYVGFWMLQSLMVLASFFIVLRFLKKPWLQNEAILVVVLLIVLVPPCVYFMGRFRKYLSETKGMIWWDDLKGSLVSWALVALALWALVHFFI